MKVGLYHSLARASMTRRRMLQGSAAVAALSALPRPGFAQDADTELRRQILQIPGVGAGSPTDNDWRRVGELCLGGTRATVEPGEFDGVELTFMGLNNQNLHNFLFRGFLRPWEEYTGARINWIDLAQADYNARLQQSIATETVDFDILEMGAPFEGDVLGKGLASEMPDWVRELIDMDDYVEYLKEPVGTWDGRLYRVSIDGDCHNLNYRGDYYTSEDLRRQWEEEGHDGAWEVPTTWEQVNEQTRFLDGKTDPFGLDAYGFLDPLKSWGGFGFYFLGDRATAYAKRPGDPAWLFDPEDMRPLVNTPPWVQAIQDVVDMIPHLPPDQLNADPNTTAFQQFLAGTGAMVGWWGDVGDNSRTSDASVVGDVIGFSILPGARRVWNREAGDWEEPEGGVNHAPNMAYIGWGIYVMARVDPDERRKKAAWSAAAHLGGKNLSLWMAAYPSGFQAYRNSHFNIPEWTEAGYDEAFIEDFLSSQVDSYNHPNAAIEPRIPGIFQYYSIAEDELAKIYAGQYGSVQEGADAIAAAWDQITDQIGRESQIALYRASLGL